MFRQLGMRDGIGQALSNLGLIHLDLKNSSSARDYSSDALECFKQMGLSDADENMRILVARLGRIPV